MIKRREFLKSGVGCCILVTGAGPFVFANDEKPDPKLLNYCGYKCPDDCKMYLAGKSDDEALKIEAYTLWRFEEKYGVRYSPEIVFCEQCKGTENPKSLLLTKCSVRNCAIEKGYDCCIECDDLKTCDKEIWFTFPQFKVEVLKMQVAYNQ
jgi:hypothetical protein